MDTPTRWARFRSDEGRVGFGVLEEERVVEYDGDIYDSPRPTGATVARGKFTLLAPCVPSKMVALWNNFRALSVKLGKQAPAHPLFLIKPSTSIVGPDELIERPNGYAGKIVYEGELGIVIGRRCKDIAAGDAGNYIFGYTCVNDVTAADLINETPDFAQWCRSKGFDTFGCIGPVIATDFDWLRARVVTRLSEVERQNYPLSDMIMSPPDVVSRVSRDMTLLPGDVIACGTSLGVGSIRDGAMVEVAIDGIGTLKNALASASPGIPASE